MTAISNSYTSCGPRGVHVHDSIWSRTDSCLIGAGASRAAQFRAQRGREAHTDVQVRVSCKVGSERRHGLKTYRCNIVVS